MARLAALLPTLAILGSGCASATTRITSYRDPDFAEATYDKLLVLADRVELGWRFEIEAAVVRHLQEAGVETVVGTTVLKPTRTYNDAGMAAILRDQGCDGLLWITLTGESAEEHFIPRSTHRYYGYHSVYLHHHGGYYVSYPVLRFRVRLQDEATGKVTWTASAITRGHQSADHHDFAASVAATIVDRLVEDGLLPARDVCAE